ncbi:MAG: glycosyl hydrolase family 28-related protein, partial [Devosia sp.]|nr:glycosyl hydrolase family 28-related protein [Devosia sp.]
MKRLLFAVAALLPAAAWAQLVPLGLSGDAPLATTSALTAETARAQAAESTLLPKTGDASAATVLPSGATTARTLAAREADVANALDFGADPTGVADSATAINAAAAATQAGVRRDVYIPAGVYHLANPVTVGATSGTAQSQCLIGDGFGTVLDVSTDFNTSAAGVISLSTLANAPDVQLCVRNLSIRFHQPQDLVTTTTVATA